MDENPGGHGVAVFHLPTGLLLIYGMYGLLGGHHADIGTRVLSSVALIC